MKILKIIGVSFIVILALLTIPTLLAIFMHAELFSRSLGDANGWLGYWGGYLGALIGAITVYLATSKQLKTQRELHEENLKKQFELHEENLKRQMESIEISANLSDLRQRDLTIATMRLNKIDIIIQELISLNILNSDRFNLLREFNQYNHLIKRISNRVEKEKKYRQIEEIISKKVLPYTRPIKIPKNKIRNIKKKRINLNFALEQRNKYINLKNEVLEKETNKRNEIRFSSAKIKSEAMFVDLDNDLDIFRAYLDNNLGFFYELVTTDQKSETEFYSLIDFHVEKFTKLNNQAIRICKQKLNYEVTSFIKGKHIH